MRNGRAEGRTTRWSGGEAKLVVAKAKDRFFDSMYKALDEKRGERLLLRMARNRDRKRKDLDVVKCIKDEG